MDDAVGTILTLVMASIIIALMLKAVLFCFRCIWATFASTSANISKAVTERTGYIRLTWFLLAKRGKVTVRASTYLMALAQTNTTPETANRLAFSIDSYAAYHLRAAALHHLNETYKGSRLALISEARLRGFTG